MSQGMTFHIVSQTGMGNQRGPLTSQSGSTVPKGSANPITPTSTAKPKRGISRKLSKRAIDNIRLFQEDRVITKCGCVVLPGTLLIIAAKRKSTYCETHGWQDITRKILPVEAVNVALVRDLSY